MGPGTDPTSRAIPNQLGLPSASWSPGALSRTSTPEPDEGVYIDNVAIAYDAPKPTVSLGAPVAPKTMRRSKSYTVYGSLKPRHAKGTKPVRIYKDKKVGGKWKSMGYCQGHRLELQGPHPLQGQDEADEQGQVAPRAYAPADSNTQHVVEQV